MTPVRFEKAIQIEYVNFRGERRTFAADRRSMRRRGAHLSVRVQPTGGRIALALERIRNRDAVERALASMPKPEEARVLNFHSQRGTTSPLCESLRAKYPDF